LPVVKPNRSSVWAQYTIRVNNRNVIQEKLKHNSIPTSIFYPVSLHLQECFHYLNYRHGEFIESEKASKDVISLPMNSFLEEFHIKHITDVLLTNLKYLKDCQ